MEKFDKTLVYAGSVVVEPSEDIQGEWVGHCLDFDVIAQGRDPQEAVEALIEAVAMTVVDDLEHGLNPLDRRAPEEFWVTLANVLKKGQQVKFSEVKGDSKVILATQITFVVERVVRKNDGFSLFNVPPASAARIDLQAAA